MTQNSDTADDSRFHPFSRMDAVELAIRTGVVTHLIGCVVTLAILAVLLRGPGILLGFGVGAVLASVIPFVVLPVAWAIGFLSHLALNGTRVSIPVFVRAVVILFEGTLFIGVVVLIVSFQTS